MSRNNSQLSIVNDELLYVSRNVKSLGFVAAFAHFRIRVYVSVPFLVVG